jgi:hypothetical protein
LNRVATTEWRAAAALLGVAYLGITTVLSGQTPPRATRVGDLATASLGMSVLEFDLANDQPYHGLSARAGVALGRYLDLSLLGQRWPRLGDFEAFAAEMEAAVHPLGRTRISPYLLVGFGYFSAKSRSNAGIPPNRGNAASFGLGVEGRVYGRLGLRVEGTARLDAGAFDDELRLMATVLPQPAVGLSRGRAETIVSVGAMATVTGPWRPVEPVYSLEFAMPLGAARALQVGTSLVHWRTANGWDTRAVLFSPAYRVTARTSGALRLSAWAGPLASLMLEGPDNGVRGGAAVGFSVNRPLSIRAGAHVGVNAVWLVRKSFTSFRSVAGEDQRAVVVRAGLAF